MKIKIGNGIGRKLETNCGVPQSDSLSKRFTFYLDFALRRKAEKLKNHQDHICSLQSPSLPFYVEYADDLDVIQHSLDQDSKRLTTIKTVFEDYNLILNEDKTEITKISVR